MACPRCECKCTYTYDDSPEGFMGTPGLERCAYCGYIFDIEEALDDEEIEDAPSIAL
jgi:hypothetical protein